MGISHEAYKKISSSLPIGIDQNTAEEIFTLLQLPPSYAQRHLVSEIVRKIQFPKDLPPQPIDIPRPIYNGDPESYVWAEKLDNAVRNQAINPQGNFVNSWLEWAADPSYRCQTISDEFERINSFRINCTHILSAIFASAPDDEVFSNENQKRIRHLSQLKAEYEIAIKEKTEEAANLTRELESIENKFGKASMEYLEAESRLAMHSLGAIGVSTEKERLDKLIALKKETSAFHFKVNIGTTAYHAQLVRDPECLRVLILADNSKESRISDNGVLVTLEFSHDTSISIDESKPKCNLLGNIVISDQGQEELQDYTKKLTGESGTGRGLVAEIEAKYQFAIDLIGDWKI